MRYATVSSGIEAPSVAWHPLGWELVWVSEIASFPNRVLKHHYPHVPNLGDMLKLHEQPFFHESTFDILCGGTPCQDYSIAGLRAGMAGANGSLSLQYCNILKAKRPQWFVWENVPGVFSSFSYEKPDNAGVDGPAIPAASQQQGTTIDDVEVWETADFATLLQAFSECGYSCCWRVLDAQYFGVPQRRRRVFVVGCFGNDWRPPAAVLFEPGGGGGDFTPSQKKGQGIADTITAGAGKRRGSGIAPESVAATVTTGTGNNFRPETLAVTWPYVLTQGYTIHGSDATAVATPSPVACALRKRSPGQIENSSTTVIAFSSKDDGRGAVENVSPTIQSQHTGNAVMYSIVPANSGKDYRAKEAPVKQALTTNGNQSGNQGGDYIVAPIAADLRNGAVGNTAMALQAGGIGKDRGMCINALPHVSSQIGVRRLTPLECERLQGFPDNYTNIPKASDAARYEALGNSMAVPVMRWLGERIALVHKFLHLFGPIHNS